MKLRNKKTGEIIDHIWYEDDCDCFAISGKSYNLYGTLKEVIDEWEDYKLKEPLIKDEKTRKAIRAWAKANNIDTAQYDDYWVSFRRDDKVISFKDEDYCLGYDGLEDNTTYSIAELCGEDEE